MTGGPLFSVVLASHGRSEHILPTIASVLGQTLGDFELLVVCDGPDPATAAVLAATVRDPRLRVLALPGHTGSQAGPNNRGIAEARGRHVAYVGHDDIWAPDHLQTLAACFDATGCGFAVGGCAYHGPPGTDLLLITGLFDDPDVARTQFFPPSSFAHRRHWPDSVPHWRSPETTRAPVDADFLLRAVAAGLRFASTGRITVHKFAAGHRYLSYLHPSSDEQADCLARLRAGGFDAAGQHAMIEQARAAGTFMCSAYPDYTAMAPGQFHRDNRANKGIDRAAPQPLNGMVRLAVTAEPRALDWHPLETDPATGRAWRWSGPSLRPRLLIPFTSDGSARIALHLLDHDPKGLLASLAIRCNDHPVAHETRRDGRGAVEIAFTARLRPDGPSVVQLILNDFYCPGDEGHGADRRRLGLMLSGFSAEPLA